MNAIATMIVATLVANGHQFARIDSADAVKVRVVLGFVTVVVFKDSVVVFNHGRNVAVLRDATVAEIVSKAEEVAATNVSLSLAASPTTKGTPASYYDSRKFTGD